MPSVLLTESVALELGANEPWPDDVELYQPCQLEQILLHENSSCLAVQAFLHMCGLSFKVEMRSNAEQMSPSGKVPFLRCGAFIIAGLEPIIAFVQNKGLSLSEKLDNLQRADMHAYMALVNNLMVNSELYVSWVDEETLQTVTKPRYGIMHSWPLSKILPWMKRSQVINKLRPLHWMDKTLEEVYKDVDHCCEALSQRLGEKTYFFNNRPTELDALVFGHLFAILTTPLPDNRLANMVRDRPNLLQLCSRIEQDYFESGEAGTST